MKENNPRQIHYNKSVITVQHSLGRTDIYYLQAILSMVHGLLKFHIDERTITVRSMSLNLPEFNHMVHQESEDRGSELLVRRGKNS